MHQENSRSDTDCYSGALHRRRRRTNSANEVTVRQHWFLVLIRLVCGGPSPTPFLGLIAVDSARLERRLICEQLGVEELLRDGARWFDRRAARLLPVRWRVRFARPGARLSLVLGRARALEIGKAHVLHLPQCRWYIIACRPHRWCRSGLFGALTRQLRFDVPCHARQRTPSSAEALWPNAPLLRAL